MRFLLMALAVSVLVLVSATLVGRAMDTEMQDRVILTRDGVTLDCVRHIEHGEVSYGYCVTVP